MKKQILIPTAIIGVSLLLLIMSKKRSTAEVVKDGARKDITDEDFAELQKFADETSVAGKATDDQLASAKDSMKKLWSRDDYNFIFKIASTGKSRASLAKDEQLRYDKLMKGVWGSVSAPTGGVKALNQTPVLSATDMIGKAAHDPLPVFNGELTVKG
jgi:hypothetical protein